LADNYPRQPHWTDAELDLIVADYFAMLALEQTGQPYVKTHHRVRLLEQINLISPAPRTGGAIERKHQNISAALQEIGEPIIRGYLPLANFQAAILDVISRRLATQPSLWVPAALDQVAEPAMPFFEPAPPLQPPRERPAILERFVAKFDAGVRDFRNRQLGKAGEEMVFHFERQRLLDEDRPDLARKVRWVAEEDGDGAGYDILSFDREGGERLVEVKTTRGNQTTPFFLTRNEHALSEERTDAFKLMRLYAFAREPRMFELTPPLGEAVRLSTHTYQARFS
jgi:hypothetical protein